jgi:hypothetical protein
MPGAGAASVWIKHQLSALLVGEGQTNLDDRQAVSHLCAAAAACRLQAPRPANHRTATTPMLENWSPALEA